MNVTGCYRLAILTKPVEWILQTKFATVKHLKEEIERIYQLPANDILILSNKVELHNLQQIEGMGQFVFAMYKLRAGPIRQEYVTRDLQYNLDFMRTVYS